MVYHHHRAADDPMAVVYGPENFDLPSNFLVHVHSLDLLAVQDLNRHLLPREDVLC